MKVVTVSTWSFAFVVSFLFDIFDIETHRSDHDEKYKPERLRLLMDSVWYGPTDKNNRLNTSRGDHRWRQMHNSLNQL